MAVDLAPAESVLNSHRGGPGLTRGTHETELLIPLLQDIQEAYGYLPREVLEWLNRQTGIALSRMYGVITFYSQFRLKKPGRHMVRCCEGTACHVKGAPLVVDTLERELGIQPGKTSEDGEFTFETVNCLGACALAPLVVVDDDYHGKMTQEKTKKIIRKVRES
jgi:NADH:ubiquinone oxidoreductase subunit E